MLAWMGGQVDDRLKAAVKTLVPYRHGSMGCFQLGMKHEPDMTCIQPRS